MKLYGYYVKENPKLTYRFSKDGDVDNEGNPVPDGYPIFIHLNDCKVINDGTRSYYDTDDAKAIPVIYLGMDYAIGEFNKRHTINGVNVDGQIVYEYNQATLYFVHEGKVYVGSFKTNLE